VNVTPAVVALLKSDEGVDGLVDGRVFGPPGKSQNDPLRVEMRSWGNVPRKTIVIMASGGAGSGAGARSRARWVQNRIDLRCYGETPHGADILHNAVYRTMTELQGFTSGDIRLIDAVVGGGPLPGRDSDADWPYTMGVYMVSAAYR